MGQLAVAGKLYVSEAVTVSESPTPLGPSFNVRPTNISADPSQTKPSNASERRRERIRIGSETPVLDSDSRQRRKRAEREGQRGDTEQAQTVQFQLNEVSFRVLFLQFGHQNPNRVSSPICKACRCSWNFAAILSNSWNLTVIYRNLARILMQFPWKFIEMSTPFLEHLIILI
ncbi:hypothetical protein F0562_000177 [Nyssa sinensis]|uniref:Uncharacterized protein n=1 Tax=Nyssa sinensis TaxID=561372 RepID=A0A5J5C0X3_9ASTE|nr:hypothetical protein F0562_000177 [Nyssa sinensis]